MRRLIIVFILLLFQNGISQHNKLTYLQAKASINKTRIGLKTESFEADSKNFTQLLLNKVFPYWYGTKWSFEGYTEVPQKGTIACGYFVSTTLRDLGLKVNRYKLAQLAPAQAAKVLSLDNSIIEISGDNSSENIKTIKSKTTEGVYFIGYDAMHVGFLLREGDDLFLIHSNYFGLSQVEKERIEVSKVFSICSKFYIVPLSSNKKLVHNWINNIVIKTN